MYTDIKRNHFLKKWIPKLFVLLTIPSIIQWMNIPLGGTTLWWSVETAFLLFTFLFTFSYYNAKLFQRLYNKRKLIAFWIYAKRKNDFLSLAKISLVIKKKSLEKIERVKIPLPIVLYLIWIIISIFHGCFKASYYWDWKNLYSNIMIYLLPVACVYFSDPSIIKNVCRTWISFAMVAFWVLLPFMQMECPAKLLIPFAFFILFWPYYNKKGVIICLVAFICVFAFGTLGARSSAIRFLASLGFSFLVLFRRYIHKTVLSAISIFFICVPIVLFTLGVTGQFNIFKFGDYIDVDISVDNSFEEGEKENLSADTRTLLYVETLVSSIENDYWLFGNSLSQGYYSKSFAQDDEIEGRGMRYSNEVGILNIFTTLGIVGVILNFWVYLYTIINVFRNCNNKALYILAILLSFRWFFSFFEEFTKFDLHTIFLWIEFGICNSNYFLKMSDLEFSRWARDLISK